MAAVVAGREQTALVPWRSNRVVWLMPFGAAHAIGHFWDAATLTLSARVVEVLTPGGSERGQWF